MAAWHILEEKIRRRLAYNIKRLRAAKGLTQEAAAEAGGLKSEREWRRCESRRNTQSPLLETIAKIALGLNADVSELFAPRPYRKRTKRSD